MSDPQTGARASLSLPGTFGLFRKLALFTLPVFFALALLGLFFVHAARMQEARRDLSAGVGNVVGQTAASLEQVLAPGTFAPDVQRAVAQRLLEMLASDTAIVCARLTAPQDPGTAALVAPQGASCETAAVDERLQVRVFSDSFSRLEVGVSQRELAVERSRQIEYALTVLLGALLISLLSSWIAFRVIVGKPMEELISDLVQARDVADTASRAKTRFLANMSHEIRTPMNGIIGTAELLSETALTPQQAAGVQTIVNSGNALMHIIEDILDFAKVEAGKLELNEDEFQLSDVVYDASDLVEPAAAAKGVDLVIDIPDLLPHAFLGDDIRLRQVILNLLGNAVKFCPQGTVRLTATVTPDDEGRTSDLTVAVRDTGIGIAPDKLEAIFSPFSQANEATTRNFGGTGLGLTISRELVQRMGGQISATSTVGEGSEFRFTVPLRRGRPVQQAPAITRIKALSEAGKLRALVVDDVDVNLQILSRRLGLWGIDAVLCTAPADALETLVQAAVSGRPFDVMILDYDMPDINGQDLAELIRDEPAVAKTPLVLLSSVAIITRLARAATSPFDATLTKPLRPKRLARALCTVLPGGEADAGDGASAAMSIADRYAGFLAGADVLVVDDSDINRDVIGQQLAVTQADLRFAVNGSEAVDECRRKRPDIVLMDISMPVMGGFEATREIRAHEAATNRRPSAILALSANVLQDHRARARAAGMDGFIGKPTRRAELLGAIAAVQLGTGDADAGAAAETRAPPVLAGEDLDELRAMVGREKLAELAARLIAQGDAALAEIRADLAAEALADAASRAHKLAGGAGTLGGRAMAAAMAALERDLLAGNAPDADRLDRAEALWQETRAALAALETGAAG